MLLVFLAMTLPPLKRLGGEADQAASVCRQLRNDEGVAETQDVILIFNPAPAPAQLVICFPGTLVSERTIPFKKDVVFSHQADEIDFPGW